MDWAHEAVAAYHRILAAAEKGQGVRLSREECYALSQDPSVYNAVNGGSEMPDAAREAERDG